MSNKESLFGKTLDDIREIIKPAGLPEYSATQITDWLYKKKAGSISRMSNISLSARNRLEQDYYIGMHEPVNRQISADGTIKYLFGVQSKGFIETVFIPDKDRFTLCISTQVGCKMGCKFCMTGKQGFTGDLSTSDILNQIYSVPDSEKLTNYVFMGMGEPLLNLNNLLKAMEIMTADYGMGISASRITVSTVGIIPQLENLLKQNRCNIAISLHSPFSSERQDLMPTEKIFPINKIISLLRKYSHERQRKISFEYILFNGLNDSARHVNGLARLLNGLRCRINLIRFHPVPGSELVSADEETIKWFRTKLNEKGFITTIRASRGQDISAACGMLSTEALQKT